MAKVHLIVSARFIFLLITLTVFLTGCGVHQAQNYDSKIDEVEQSAPLHSHAWKKYCGGLFQLPVAA